MRVAGSPPSRRASDLLRLELTSVVACPPGGAPCWPSPGIIKPGRRYAAANIAPTLGWRV
jgi:hypothetical protein